MKLPALVAGLVSCFLAASALAQPLPATLANEVLSDVAPQSFAPLDLTAADFATEWNGDPIEGVEMSLAPRTLEWVRVRDVLVLPRARLMIKVKGALGGWVRQAGFTQPLAVESGDATAELPVALMSGDANAIDLAVTRKSEQVKGRLRVVYRPRSEKKFQSAVDTSCSPWRVELQPESGIRAVEASRAQESWAYVGCRFVYVEGEKHRASSLEIFLYWEGASALGVGDAARIEESSASVWTFRLRSVTGATDAISLDSAVGGLTLKYRVPTYPRFATVGFGIGPYWYQITGGGPFVETYVPLATLYASYFFSESTRLVIFNATAIHKRYFSDLGLYLSTESFRFLDTRVSFRVMLGAHAVLFSSSRYDTFHVSAPQGVEIIWRDFGLTGYSAAAGAFVYPPILGRHYYNAWLRWGSPKLFAELNVIAWREPERTGAIGMRTFGVSLGVPALRFL